MVSLRCRKRNGQEFIRYILSMATNTILYQRWKPLARLSLMKKVCENTKPCCSSPKKIGPSRPGQTYPRREEGLYQYNILAVLVRRKHTARSLPHSWGCAHRPGGPRWTAEAVWDAGGSGSECLFHRQCSQSRGELQEVIDIPKREGEQANKQLKSWGSWVSAAIVN